jgi:hypothetical protein
MATVLHLLQQAFERSVLYKSQNQMRQCVGDPGGGDQRAYDSLHSRGCLNFEVMHQLGSHAKCCGGAFRLSRPTQFSRLAHLGSHIH